MTAWLDSNARMTVRLNGNTRMAARLGESARIVRTGSWTGPPRGERAPRADMGLTAFRVHENLIHKKTPTPLGPL